MHPRVSSALERATWRINLFHIGHYVLEGVVCPTEASRLHRELSTLDFWTSATITPPTGLPRLQALLEGLLGGGGGSGMASSFTYDHAFVESERKREEEEERA